MFDIGWSELLIIGVVALIVIGPKELPGVLRAIGQWTGKIRRMAAEFQDQFRDAMREAEIADLKQQFEKASHAVSPEFDPMNMSVSPVNKSTPSVTDSIVSTSQANLPEANTTELSDLSLPTLPEPAPAITEENIAASTLSPKGDSAT